MPTLTLVVVRCRDLEHSRRFYQALGLAFTPEQHGAGPLHYSTQLGTTVLELYPASATPRARSSPLQPLGFLMRPQLNGGTLGGTVTSALSDLTLSELRGAGITPALESDGTLRIAARDAKVGDIVVSFEGDEISVFLGDITHCHFTPYAPQESSPGCTPMEAAADASQFIREMVSDQWVIWRWRDGRGGCFKPGGNDDERADAPLPGEEVESFVWSGRLVPPNTSLERTREG